MDICVDMTQPREKQMVLNHVRALQGIHRVEIVKFRPRRTDRQNRYYWPCVVQSLADFLREQGESYTDEMAHEILKYKFLRTTVLSRATGEVVGERVRSTTELSIEEFSKYVEQCIDYLADTFGIQVPAAELMRS